MMKKGFLLGGWLLAIALLGGCGDIGNIQVDIEFPDAETELRTRSLMFVVRQVPAGKNGCEDLWSAAPEIVAENRVAVLYPNRTDLLASAVKLSEYDTLTFLVYAHTTSDPEASEAIAGGCAQTPVEPDITSVVNVAMENR